METRNPVIKRDRDPSMGPFSCGEGSKGSVGVPFHNRQPVPSWKTAVEWWIKWSITASIATEEVAAQ